MSAHRTDVARRLVARLLPVTHDLPLALRLWDGSEFTSGPPGPPQFRVIVRSPRALGRLARRPTPLRVGQAFIDGALDVEGDLFAAMRLAHRLEDRTAPIAVRLAGLVQRLGRPWRNARRDIASHYDLPAEFYALFLDPRLVYTCAYYRHPEADLAQAQADKLDVICRKLRLRRGDRFLDLGCGWGSLVMWAAEHYGAQAYGVTLSRAQAEWAAAAIGRAGLADRAGVEHLDYRSLPPDRRFDKIAAVGLIEHLGIARYPAFFRQVRQLLEDDGVFLNHGITIRTGARWTSEMEFLARYVFPGLELADLSTTLGAMERAGFEIADVEGLGLHYARTTRQWAERLRAEEGRARELVGERTYRTWLAYLAAASVAFSEGWIGLHQTVAAHNGRGAGGAAPATRDSLYR